MIAGKEDNMNSRIEKILKNIDEKETKYRLV